MPCWEVNTYTLAFKATNVKMMMKVLDEMDLRPKYNEDRQIIRTSIGTFNLNTGDVEVDYRNRSKVNEFRKNYSMKAIETAATKFKWNIKKKVVKGKAVFNAVKW